MPPYDSQVLLGLGKVLLAGPVDVAAAKRSADTQLGSTRPDEITQPALAGIAVVAVPAPARSA